MLAIPLKLSSLALALVLIGCGERPLRHRGPTLPCANIREVIDANPLGNRDSLATPLWRTEVYSASLVQLRGSIGPHYHAERDELVHIVQGKAVMHTGNASFEVIPGDVFTIPRRTIHSVEAISYCAAIVIYTPPFDERDRVPVDK